MTQKNNHWAQRSSVLYDYIRKLYKKEHLLLITCAKSQNRMCFLKYMCFRLCAASSLNDEADITMDAFCNLKENNGSKLLLSWSTWILCPQAVSLQ